MMLLMELPNLKVVLILCVVAVLLIWIGHKPNNKRKDN
jgi:hypothetical protein